MTDRRLPYKDDNDAPFIKRPCSVCGSYVYEDEDELATATDVRCDRHRDREAWPPNPQ